MRLKPRLGSVAAGTAVGWLLSVASASAQLSVADVPLFVPGAVPPLNMLVMGRDHTLYYEAYNDASDLDGDGTPDVGYKPADIDYFGYFDSYKCYTYSSGRFSPAGTTTDKTCSGQWSGDFLNYLTTSRIDALRKVLYGGRRSTDTTTETVLERSFIPQDAHSWGKEYTSPIVDGYEISDYTPYTAPTYGNRHLFANTTPSGTSAPLLRTLQNQPFRIWNWVSIERPVAGDRVEYGGTDHTVTPNDMIVRVEVCDSSMLEANCKEYPDGNYKPVGLLQDFGEQDKMLFGLLSGSYANNLQGGVLRRNIQSIQSEIDPDDGRFTGTSGIIDSIDKLQIAGFTGANYSYYHPTDAWITTRPLDNGELQDWGNPIAEMMYETLRYFAGRGSPTADFQIASSGNTDAALGLPVESWQRPYQQFPVCSAGVQTVISGIYPSYDTDAVPGSAFTGYSGDLSGLNASSIGDDIWAHEHGAPQQHFIGQSGAVSDGAPTPKTVGSFGDIRGLAPEEPTKLGGYYSASVAHYGVTTDLLPTEDGTQNIASYVVALASPLPRIEIPVRDHVVTLVPFGKSVRDYGISAAPGDFQPTNTIVDFYVESIANTNAANADSTINEGRPFGRFRINFEDVEQGADHDMDAIVFYEFKVNGSGEVEIDLVSEYAAGGIEQHLGYVISGTTADGIYLEVRDEDTTSDAAVNYFLDTPPSVAPGTCAQATPPAECSTVLPLTAHRTFTPSGDPAATLLKDPLWYAAKWGGFKDTNGNDIPDLQEEWDESGNGSPDNYFLVTNALTLKDQMSEAFNLILSTTSSASAVATNSTRLDTETLIYQARFRSDDWTGQLLAYRLEADGSLGNVQWDAAEQIPDHSVRQIYTRDESGAGIEFLWDELGTNQKDALNRDAQGNTDGLGQDRLDWLRGDQGQERQAGGTFRDRSVVLGDIINSDPVFVGAQNFGYEALPPGTPGQDTYQAFRQSKMDSTGAALSPTIYVGANDGMLHAFDAESGVEKLAYLPSTLIPELSELSEPDYSHRYYVDGHIFVGDAYIDRGGVEQWTSVLVGTTGAGGRTVYALDVTDPDTFSESDVLWEFTDPDLGYTIGQPTVARMADGTWAAVFGNGYNSDNHKAMLFIVDLETGALIRKIDTLAGGVGTPNGLATPSLLADGSRTIRAIYAGDLLGNVWKFDVDHTNAGQWGVSFNGNPMFIATDPNGARQPITAPIEIGRHPQGGGYMIYFGTGKFFETGDNLVGAAPQVQSFYGLWDKSGNNTRITYTAGSRNSVLTQQEILYEGMPPGSHFDVRVTSEYDVDWDNKRGWYLDLVSPNNGAEGERVVASPILRGGRIIFPTLIPSPDPCGFGGNSWLMEIEAVSGSRLVDSPLDINEDGNIDAGDFVTVQLGDGTELTVPVSAIRSREGIIRTPAIVSAGELEYKLSSGTSGNVETLRERGAYDRARGAWRQLR
ncbi:MAG: fimbrial assembly protein [Gammaproteobacteria bacterium]|nr:fimbrial assembly protein [Gammaproteobacteria bacterium]